MYEDDSYSISECYVTNIIVPRSAFDSSDAFAIVGINIDYLNSLFDNGEMNASEVPYAAVLSYQVDYWSAQICNGGHGQFYGNSIKQTKTLDWVEAGLAEMEATAYFDIFKQFRTLIASDPVRASRIAEGCGFGEIDPAIRELDDAFFALGSAQLVELNNRFLRSQKALVVVDDDQLVTAWAAAATQNPHIAERRSERLALRAAAEAVDPMYLAARVLCGHCALEFERFTAGSVAPNGGMVWGIVTNGGIRMMHLDDRAAALFIVYDDARANRNELARVKMVDGRPGRPTNPSKLRRLFGF